MITRQGQLMRCRSYLSPLQVPQAMSRMTRGRSFFTDCQRTSLQGTAPI